MMRFVIYWLIRGAAAALPGGFALFFWMYALEHVAIGAASNPTELATLATMPPDEVGAIFRHMMLSGHPARLRAHDRTELPHELVPGSNT
ncbi:hypothetical protein SAE02_71770 [Skermanella aerolata]|uniref:Uncharacterized protein n=1 Tax=Skermanella aerolata TaxID=393310 RepID=A0A512E2S9_9PROT|nr:hypothetical protein N826_34280 [Skermanella aerolata KACC 11604]GEO43029.1 hypothetical protein SAE02_71770 [Skermanella aerolata]